MFKIIIIYENNKNGECTIYLRTLDLPTRLEKFYYNVTIIYLEYHFFGISTKKNVSRENFFTVTKRILFIDIVAQSVYICGSKF